MTTIAQHLLTADEFAALPREGLRLELVRGEIGDQRNTASVWLARQNGHATRHRSRAICARTESR